MQFNKNCVIGIDLGNSNTCSSLIIDERIEIITNEQGNQITPTYVSFTDYEKLVGDSAKNQAAINPQNTIYDILRMIGLKYSTLTKNTQWSFQIVSDLINNSPLIEVQYAGESLKLTPEEVLTMILANQKSMAEQFSGISITNAIIACPASFSASQLQAVRDSAEAAKLHIVELINQPVACCYAYGLQNIDSNHHQNALVFSFGGSSTEVTLLQNQEDQFGFQILATVSDTALGGNSIDQIIQNYMRQVFEQKRHLNINNNLRAIRRLRNGCERAKRALSSCDRTQIEIDCLFQGEDFVETLTRAKFEELCQELFEKSINMIESVLTSAQFEKNQVDKVILAGGSCRIPKVKQTIMDYFGPNTDVACTVEPDEAAAFGAAARAMELGEGDV